MIDHVSLRVSDFERSMAFYRRALAPLGYAVIVEFPGAAGMGVDGKPDFWVTKAEGTPVTTTHLAFLARDRKTVDAFFEAAVAAGGKDNGAPGPRAIYHPGYYGAFVLDPDGHNIEAVIHKPE